MKNHRLRADNEPSLLGFRVTTGEHMGSPLQSVYYIYAHNYILCIRRLRLDANVFGLKGLPVNHPAVVRYILSSSLFQHGFGAQIMCADVYYLCFISSFEYGPMLRYIGDIMYDFIVFFIPHCV